MNSHTLFCKNGILSRRRLAAVSSTYKVLTVLISNIKDVKNISAAGAN